jgi:polyisoprenoid-binding protein YceI
VNLMRYNMNTNMKKHRLMVGAVAVAIVTAAVLFGAYGHCSPVRPTGAQQLAAAESATGAAPAPAVAAPAPPTAGMTVYNARSGGKMRIEGTANIIHPTWQIEGTTIGGMMEVGSNFPTEPGQTVAPGKVDAKADVFIPVRSLTSRKEDGEHYNDRMDEVTYEHLKEAQFKRIFYHLSEMTLKELPKSNDAPYVFEAKGDLAISGVTNKTTMTVNVLPTLYKTDKVTEKRLEITGTTAVKMTDFKDEIVDINLGIGHIKTGDEVKLVFKWIVGQKRAPVAAAP